MKKLILIILYFCLYNSNIINKKGSEIIYKVNYNLLRDKRKEKHFTLDYMAKALGLSNRTSYYHKEVGDNPFKDYEISKVISLLGISVNDFFIKED